MPILTPKPHTAPADPLAGPPVAEPHFYQHLYHPDFPLDWQYQSSAHRPHAPWVPHDTVVTKAPKHIRDLKAELLAELEPYQVRTGDHVAELTPVLKCLRISPRPDGGFSLSVWLYDCRADGHPLHSRQFGVELPAHYHDRHHRHVRALKRRVAPALYV